MPETDIPETEVSPQQAPPDILPGKETKLSDETMGRLISAFGNHEAKALTLLIMDSGQLYNSSQLHRRFVDSQGREPGWVTGHSRELGYCSQSLSPIGLVVREELQQGTGEYGYRLSKPGENGAISGEDARLLAALLLDFSSRYPDISLIDLFGSTQSSIKDKETTEEITRSPINRWKIFLELVTSNLTQMSQADLEKGTLIPQGILIDHLIELSRKKIINYEYVDKGKPYTYYILAPDHPDIAPVSYLRYTIPTQRFFKILSENPGKKLTTEEIINVYIDRYDPEKTLQDKTLEAYATRILNHLNNLGYAQKGEFGVAAHSAITITPEKQAMLLDLLTLLDRFQDQDPGILLQAGELLRKLWSDGATVSTLMKKAHDHSPAVKKRDRKITMSYIGAILQADPEATTREVQEQLFGGHGIDLSRGSVAQLIAQVRKNQS